MVINEVLMMTRLMRVTRSRLIDKRKKRFYLERSLWVECTSGQSEDYLSHWGGLYRNTVFVLLWSNGPCKLRSMVCVQ
jgi:hypothetical protein